MRLCQGHRIRTLSFGVIIFFTIGLTTRLQNFQKKSSEETNLSPLVTVPPSLPPPNPTTTTPPPPPRTCQPKKHIMFLKTHKTAGSTILNLLNRYGDRNGLTFALPFQSHDFNYPRLFHTVRVKGFYFPFRPQYDILCHHMRFNLPEVQKVMPSDSVYFTILRDPAKMAESAFYYYRNVASAFIRAHHFKAFILRPSYYYRQGEIYNEYAHNPLWFDLGLNPDAHYTEAVAESGTQMVERTFNLVLLAEYFDESMILLKEELCWDLDDVVTFKMNSRGALRTLEEWEVQKLREWNALDWFLYSHFNRTFWEKVERFGRSKMDNEVKRLRERRQQLAEVCLESLDPVEAEDIKDDVLKPYQSGLDKILGWAVRTNLTSHVHAQCIQMVTPELQYKDLLDARQFPKRAQNVGKKAPRNVITLKSIIGQSWDQRQPL